jgi:hypothetical protein
MTARASTPTSLATSSPGYFLKKYGDNGSLNRLSDDDTAAHRWYRFVLSYPPHLVRDYLASFGATADSVVLDPFCGTGTTVVEAKKQQIQAVGVESHPMAHFASAVKLDWSQSSAALLRHASAVADEAQKAIDAGGPLRTLTDEQAGLLLKDSISPLPLHKTLILLAAIERHKRRGSTSRRNDMERLALAKAVVFSISNLRFGPEVGVRGHKDDADVVGAWLGEVENMAADLTTLHALDGTPAVAHRADSRDLHGLVAPGSIDCVITSPPYPNEKDYTRTTRLETVLLGFASTREWPDPLDSVRLV